MAMEFTRATVEAIQANIYSRTEITDTTPDIGIYYAGALVGSWRAATFVDPPATTILTTKVGPFDRGETVWLGVAQTNTPIDFTTLTNDQYDIHTRHTEGAETPVLYAYTFTIRG